MVSVVVVGRMVANAIAVCVSKDLSVTASTALAPMLPVILEAPVHRAEQEVTALKSRL